MGEIADMIIEGILCEKCGGVVDELKEDDDPNAVVQAPGYPRTCKDCIREARKINKANRYKRPKRK